MLRWTVVTLVLVSVSGIDWKLNRLMDTQFDCFDYPSEVPYRTYEPGWALRKSPKFSITTPKYLASPTPFNLMSRRFDVFLSNRDDIVKEHAKLVQDINGLKQAMFVPPIPDETRDYDDSIFQEIIEISTTSRPAVKTTKPPNTKTTKGFPIVLLGGSNRKVSVRSPQLPLKGVKQTISLVGTSVTPLVKPYIMASSNRLPMRICMPFPTPSPKRRLSIWERLLKSIIPR